MDLLLGAYVLGLIPGLLAGGSASDRCGRRPVLVLGTAISAVSSLALAAGAHHQSAMYAGRILAGAGVGIAMSVGSTWVTELSGGRKSAGVDLTAGARRASLSLTLGFCLGAGVAGALAQWGPHPTVAPYLTHIALSVGALGFLSKVTETPPRCRIGILQDPQRSPVPLATRRHFLRIVAPSAPWVFGSAGLAYALTPQMVATQVRPWGLAYSTLLTVTMLGTAAIVQPCIKRANISPQRTVVLGMTVTVVAAGVCTANAANPAVWLGIIVAWMFGAACGITLLAGLLEVQRITLPADLAVLTGVYFSLAYLGFLLPALLAALAPVFPYPVMLGVITGLAFISLTIVASAAPRRGGTAPHAGGARSSSA